MKCILFGGSGEVGGAVARELIKSEVCSQLTLLGRRNVAALEGEPKVNSFVVDTSAADFENVVKEHARGHQVAISCIGVGSGNFAMSEDELTAIEVNLVGKFARGCKAAGVEIFEHLTAVGGSEAQANSRVMPLRVLGKKHKVVVDVGFEKLAVFKPGMIVGNTHTPQWITCFTRLIPDRLGWGNIRQQEVGLAFVAHLQKKVTVQCEPVVSYGNKEMKCLIRE